MQIPWTAVKLTFRMIGIEGLRQWDVRRTITVRSDTPGHLDTLSIGTGTWTVLVEEVEVMPVSGYIPTDSEALKLAHYYAQQGEQACNLIRELEQDLAELHARNDEGRDDWDIVARQTLASLADAIRHRDECEDSLDE